MKRIYRPDEVAEMLDISKRTVYRMILEKRLPAVRFGNGPWRITAETLDNILYPERKWLNKP